jgi:hypothetical protein
MVQILSPKGGHAYTEAVRTLKQRENAARAKAQEIMCKAETLAETSLALSDCEVEIEQARTRFLNELRGIMEREYERTEPSTPDISTSAKTAAGTSDEFG